MSERDIQLYLDDILDSGNAIMGYIKSMSFDDFCNDRKTYSAVVREFEIIGEAVGNLPDGIKQRRSEVEWQDIKDFRNLLIHEYFGVDLEIVWKVIQDDLPVLINAVNEIRESLKYEPLPDFLDDFAKVKKIRCVKPEDCLKILKREGV